MHLLVTGGLGFIGSNFVRYLLAHTDWTVTNLDCLTYAGNPENLKEFEKDPRYRWVRADIADGTAVAPLMKEAEVVVHFAAETHVDRSIREPHAFLRTNILGTHTLLEAARERRPRLFVHVGTDEVYGSLEEGEATEENPLKPNSPYAASKAASDLLARSYYVTYGVPVLITRCSNNFGPYQFPEKALPLLITNALENRPYPLYGDGGHIRDWLYVLDHVKAILLLIEKGRPGEIYNIGGTCSLPNKELVRKILRTMGKPDSLIEKVPDRPGHDRRYALNCDKLRRLGWRPEKSFEEALEATIDWYASRESWWRPIKERPDYRNYYRRQYGK
jgi:dTDP-glucose 4,6-dehydratase